MAITVNYEKEPAPGSLKLDSLYCLSMGQVIGAGVITTIVPAIKMTGNSAWFAYFVAIILGAIIIMPNVFIGSTIRFGGGQYSLLCGLAGPGIGGVYAWTYLMKVLSLSLFGSSAAAYLGDIIPALSSHGARIAVAAFLLSLFWACNMGGVDIMAFAQKAMSYVLFAALLLYAVMGICKLKYPIFDVSDPGWLTMGWGITVQDRTIKGGFIGAVLLFIYSCQGYYMTIAYGRDAVNARRDIPRAILLSIPSITILYCGCAMAGSGVMSIEEYGSSVTLVYSAREILSPVLFYFFIIGGPIMALLTTLNSSFAFNAITIGQSCKDGWLPKWFGKENKKGSYVYILTFMYVVGMIPVLFGLSTTVITNISQLSGSFFAFFNLIAYWQFPKMYKEAWEASKYHVPNGLYYFFCVGGFALQMVILWKATLSMSMGWAIANIVAFCLLGSIGFIKLKSANVGIKFSLWTGNEEWDMKAVKINQERAAKLNGKQTA